MLLPLLLVVSQVPAKRLLAPGALGGVRDGRPGADALVGARVLEVERQGAVAAHGVTGDGDPLAVNLGELLEDEIGELLGEVRLHLVVLAPRVLGGVDVEGGGAAKVVGVVLARVIGAAGAGVGEEQGEAQGGGVGVQEALFCDIVGGAGKAGEVDEERRRLGGRSTGREEDVEVHGGAGGGGLVGELEELAPEGVDGRVCGECHD